MDDLPFVDEHAIAVAAAPDAVWPALLAVARGAFGAALPRPVAALWGLEHARPTGGMKPGAALTGFTVAEARPPQRLVLRGRHRFSRYALVFAVEPVAAGGSRVRAETWAAFPGVHGRLYRALVIGSGGHRIITRRLLRAVAARAGR